MLFHPQQYAYYTVLRVSVNISVHQLSVVNKGTVYWGRAIEAPLHVTSWTVVACSHGFRFDGESTISNYLHLDIWIHIPFPAITHHLSDLRRSRNVAPPLLNPNLFQKFVLCLRKNFQWQRVMRLPRVHCLDILALQQKSSKLSTRRGLCKWLYANVNVCRPGAAGRQVSGEAGYGRIAS